MGNDSKKSVPQKGTEAGSPICLETEQGGKERPPSRLDTEAQSSAEDLGCPKDSGCH